MKIIITNKKSTPTDEFLDRIKGQVRAKNIQEGLAIVPEDTPCDVYIDKGGHIEMAGGWW